MIAGFDAAIEQALGSLEGGVPEDYCNWIESSAREFRQIQQQIGVDLRGVLRRKQLVPMVLIPDHVAGKHGNTLGPPPDDKISLKLQLQEAQEAFVFGIPLAGISHLRALAELVLTYHYRFSEGNLERKIEQLHAERRMKDSLHKLRMLANDVLHYGGEQNKTNVIESEFVRQKRLKREKERHERLARLARYAASLANSESLLEKDETIKMEDELISYLYALRELIENAPNPDASALRPS